MDAPAPYRELLTRPQLAAVLGISEHTLRAWAVQKRGPRVTKVGRLSRYDRRDVDDYLSAQRANAS